LQPTTQPPVQLRSLSEPSPQPTPLPPPPTPGQIDKLTLEATYVGDASMAPREYLTLSSPAQVPLRLLAGCRAAAAQLPPPPAGAAEALGCAVCA
jgi:hypothetical protein